MTQLVLETREPKDEQLCKAVNNHHHQGFCFTPVGGTPLCLLSSNIIFGNIAPVWTYSLFKIILPMSFWMTPRLLVVSWAPLCHMFCPPVVFQPWGMPCPLVLVGANLVDNISDTCLWADPACTFSVMQC